MSTSIPNEHGAAAVLIDLDHGDAALTPQDLQHHSVFRGKNGHPKDIGAVYRAFERGEKGADGKRIKLEWAKAPGGKRVTSASALRRWLAALNNVSPSPARQQADAHQRAQRQLAAAGL